MKSAKAKEQLLEKKKRRLEANVAAGDKFLDEVPREIKEELMRICQKLGLLDVLMGRRKFEAQTISVLTASEKQIFFAFHQVIFAHAEATVQLKETKLLLEPSPPGRPKGRRNQKYKPVDPTIAAALQDPQGLTRMELAHKHSGLKTRDEKQKWIWKYDKEKAKQTRPHPHS